jgi:pimeloyl-ACP methyl ester carboxylesterase
VTYAAAVAHFAALRAREAADPRVNPEAASILLEHGHATPKAIVFLHGFTSSPKQFVELGAFFFDRGFNVLLPRMPAHGFRDRLTAEPARLTQGDYLGYLDDALELGRPLGEHLTVAGLSVSGTLAAWAAQNGRQLDQAVLLAPALAPFGLPMRLVRPFVRMARRLPNAFVWWDPLKRARVGPATSYPRFSSHAIAEAFDLAVDVYAAAALAAPRASDIVCVTNARDRSVNNRATSGLLDRWRQHGATIREHVFRGEVKGLHDFIGPYQPDARADLVYPLLWELIDRRA